MAVKAELKTVECEKKNQKLKQENEDMITIIFLKFIEKIQYDLFMLILYLSY